MPFTNLVEWRRTVNWLNGCSAIHQLPPTNSRSQNTNLPGLVVVLQSASTPTMTGKSLKFRLHHSFSKSLNLIRTARDECPERLNCCTECVASPATEPKSRREAALARIMIFLIPSQSHLRQPCAISSDALRLRPRRPTKVTLGLCFANPPTQTILLGP